MAIVSYFIKVVSLEYLEFSDDNATAISAFSVGIMGESSSPTILRSCYRGAVADHNTTFHRRRAGNLYSRFSGHPAYALTLQALFVVRTGGIGLRGTPKSCSA